MGLNLISINTSKAIFPENFMSLSQIEQYWLFWPFNLRTMRTSHWFLCKYRMALSISLRKRGYKMDNVSRQAAGWDGRFPDHLEEFFALKNKGKKLKACNNKNFVHDI